MKTLTSTQLARCLFLFLSLTAMLSAGCSTTKKVDWASRVGSFTYDQAIGELGPPDKQAKLSDGQTVAEWITRRPGGSGFSIGTGYAGGNTGVGVSQSVGAGRSDRVLRLTFDTDDKLSAWSRNY